MSWEEEGGGREDGLLENFLIGLAIELNIKLAEIYVKGEDYHSERIEGIRQLIQDIEDLYNEIKQSRLLRENDYINQALELQETAELLLRE